MEAFCPSCEEVKEVDESEDNEGMVYCSECGEEFTPQPQADPKFANYLVGEVLQVDAIPKSNLKKVLIDVGDGKEGGTQVVTNAKYCDKGWRVVVATVGAVVPAGADLKEDADAIVVKKSSVQGVKSEGMVCDAPMLGWTGGGKGAIQQLDDTFEIGSAPPAERPAKK
mmetsp:Transcript_16677/g.32485  ORF Transcript_16677/g.32485 Transcript_16677/m.32485 type:complete len:168 (+) Transcript_16677:24-527(+)